MPSLCLTLRGQGNWPRITWRTFLLTQEISSLKMNWNKPWRIPPLKVAWSIINNSPRSSRAKKTSKEQVKKIALGHSSCAYHNFISCGYANLYIFMWRLSDSKIKVMLWTNQIICPNFMECDNVSDWLMLAIG